MIDYERKDYEKYYVKNPDGGFSPERNKAIIEQSIKDYEKERALRRKLYRDDLMERADATVSYLMKLERAGDTPAERYFGKKELSRLRAQKILQTIQKMTPLGAVIKLGSLD